MQLLNRSLFSSSRSCPMILASRGPALESHASVGWRSSIDSSPALVPLRSGQVVGLLTEETLRLVSAAMGMIEG